MRYRDSSRGGRGQCAAHAGHDDAGNARFAAGDYFFMPSTEDERIAPLEPDDT